MTEHAKPRSTSRRFPHLRGDDRDPHTPTRQPSRVTVLQRGLAVATAALLAVDAYVHFHDAGRYDIVTSSTISEGTLFRVQAAVAVVVAVALLIRPRPVVWAIAVLVAASAAGAVLLYTYVDVGALGPLPDLYEHTWARPGKRATAVAETAAALLALAGLAVALRTRRQAVR
jgi:hypothetical protein